MFYKQLILYGSKKSKTESSSSLGCSFAERDGGGLRTKEVALRNAPSPCMLLLVVPQEMRLLIGHK